MVCKRVVVTGLVQGVGFRASTAREAARIGGLAGWVRNLDNGAVEVFVQGPAEGVQALLRWCSKGPPVSRVETVSDATDINDKPDFALRGFKVRD